LAGGADSFMGLVLTCIIWKRGLKPQTSCAVCQGTGLTLRIFTPDFEVSFGPQPEKYNTFGNDKMTFPENTGIFGKSLDISEPGCFIANCLGCGLPQPWFK